MDKKQYSNINISEYNNIPNVSVTLSIIQNFYSGSNVYNTSIPEIIESYYSEYERTAYFANDDEVVDFCNLPLNFGYDFAVNTFQDIEAANFDLINEINNDLYSQYSIGVNDDLMIY